jgi:signal transduction histidine kinase
MSQTAKAIFRNLLVVATIACALLCAAALYGMGALWANVRLFRDAVIPEHQVAQQALRASLDFKWQVQEWKDLLLRGTDEAAVQRLWLAVLRNETQVRSAMQALRSQSQDPQQRAAVQDFLRAHGELGLRYREVMAFFVEHDFDPRAADRLIQGADRPVLKLLVDITEQAERRAQEKAALAQDAAYAALQLSLAGLGLGLLTAVAAFVLLLRRTVMAPTRKAFADLHAATELLVQSERMASLGSLVAGVAHEINTPVGVTLTSATALHKATQAFRRQLDAGPVRKQDVAAYLDFAAEGTDLITANALRAADLIQSFKQIAADQTSEAHRAFNLKPYIQDVLRSLGPRLKASKMRVAVHCPEELQLDSYPGALAQVITNLVLNALMHAFDEGQAGTLGIEVAPHGEQLDMVFRDDGHGIAPEHVDKVFDPFFTTRRGSGGTGLGLSIVHGIVTRTLKGQIRLRSMRGNGTEFLITLPRALPDLPVPAK